MGQNFNAPVENMLQDARTMHTLFLLDKALFVVIDADLDDPFAADFLLSIETSEGWETAETREDQQEQETADVKDAMKTAGAVYKTAKFYIEKAYANKPAIAKKFGLDDYDAAKGNQAKMSLFLKNLHTQCEVAAQKTALLAAGMTQTQIDAIGAAKDIFSAEDSEQNAFIKQSAKASDLRDKQYNQTFGFMQKINRASKVVFMDDFIKQNEYELPHGSVGATFNTEGKVTDGSNSGAPLKGVRVRCDAVNIETFSNFAGNWGLNLPEGNNSLTFYLDHYTPVRADTSLPQNGHVVVNKTMVLQP